MNISEMRDKLKKGDVVVGTCVCGDKNIQIGRIFANCGFDFIIIDCEHWCYSTETVADMIAFSKLSGIVPLVKIDEYNYSTFSKYLDAGADGFILPRVRTKKEVTEVIEWTNFYPNGVRGYSPISPFCDYGKDIKNISDHKKLVTQKNNELFIVIQFETEDSIVNVDEILSIEGVDAVVMGPADLSLSLGCVGDFQNSLMKDSIKKVFDSCKKHGVVIGTATLNINDVKQYIDNGLQFLWYGNSLSFLQNVKKDVEEIKTFKENIKLK